MEKRNIIAMIVLAFITFGIYILYWYIKFQIELKKQTEEGFDGLAHFLISIATLGIYALYWQFAAGKRLAKQGADDWSILYLLLALFSLGWINPFLMQHQANKL